MKFGKISRNYAVRVEEFKKILFELSILKKERYIVFRNVFKLSVFLLDRLIKM